MLGGARCLTTIGLSATLLGAEVDGPVVLVSAGVRHTEVRACDQRLDVCQGSLRSRFDLLRDVPPRDVVDPTARS